MEKIADYFPELNISKTASEVDLKYWAVKCATDYLNNGVSLNSSIKEIATSNDLNKEHVKRISEMANSEVFQRRFDLDQDKNIYFDVADPNKINDEGPLNHKTDVMDYTLPPSYESGQNEKIASLDDRDYGDMHIDPMLDLYELKTDLTRIKQDLDDSLIMDTLREKVARDYMLSVVIDELDNSPFYKIAQAVYTVEPTVIDDLTYDLMAKNALNSSMQKEIMDIGMYKVSHNVNESHDLIKAAKEYKSFRDKVATVSEALKEVDSQLVKLSYKIKELKEIQ